MRVVASYYKLYLIRLENAIIELRKYLKSVIQVAYENRESSDTNVLTTNDILRSLELGLSINIPKSDFL